MATTNSNGTQHTQEMDAFVELAAVVSIRRLLQQRFRCNDPAYARLCVRQWIRDLRRIRGRPSKREIALKFAVIARATEGAS